MLKAQLKKLVLLWGGVSFAVGIILGIAFIQLMKLLGVNILLISSVLSVFCITVLLSFMYISYRVAKHYINKHADGKI